MPLTTRVPSIVGVIDRRMLVNFRIDPARARAVLPPPFRPQLVGDHAIGGICLIRLTQIRPQGWPAGLGARSENAAHRIAVEWDDRDGRRTGVFIPRRDSSSRLNTVLGGRLFPGEHHPARFAVDETADRLAVHMRSRDGAGSITVRGHVASALPAGSVFDSAAAVSDFFEAGSLGYSPGRAGHFDGLELAVDDWSVTPLDIEHVRSSFFDDPTRFPPGTATFGNALLMRGISHRWHQRERLYGGDGTPQG